MKDLHTKLIDVEVNLNLLCIKASDDEERYHALMEVRNKVRDVRLGLESHLQVASEEDVPDDAEVMTLDDFLSCCRMGLFTDYDGSGYYVIDGKMRRDMPATPSAFLAGKINREFTHVAWFNK